jgi:ABC-type uncharacterized transport system permease subunit
MEERRGVNALVVIMAAGVVIGLLAGLFAGASVSPELHRILLLTAPIVLLTSVVTGILIYRRPSAETMETAGPDSSDE